MKKVFLLIISSLFFGLLAFTQQIKSFSVDSVLYLEELKKFSNNYINESDKPVLEKFSDFWEDKKFSWKEMQEIIDISNLFLKKGGRPSPDFADFFEIILRLKTDSLGTAHANITEWKKIIKYFLDNKDVPLRITQQFLKLTINLFKESALYINQSTKWKSIQPNFRFEFNNKAPRVRFENIDLYCYAKRDSISIHKTSGYLEPVEMNWFGKNGIVTWERAGLPKDSVYAELSNYRISMKRTEYQADSIKFTYKKYFDSPLEGRLDEQVMLISDPERSLYPKFFSYQNKYILPDLFEGIQYRGGLSMQGAKLVGIGNEYEPALLEIYQKDTLRISLKTRQILISPYSITSPNARITLYIGTDSICHPDVIFNYQEKTDMVRLTKSDTYTSATPYSNSYHKVNMNFDELSWKRNSREIFFKPMTGSSSGTASFESDNFFNYNFWEQLQGMDNIHPLLGLWEYSKSIGFDQFPVINYSNYIGIESYQVRHLLMKLSRLGFIYFNDVADMVKINSKLYYFIDASIGKTDYDVINFTSKTEAPQENAKLNLDNYDLHINGVQNILLSDSQNVFLRPNKNQIVLKHNRNFSFDGSLRAGLFTFFGSNFVFNYDTFKFNLQQIDSLRLLVRTDEKDNFGQPVIKRIDNIIEHITGELLVDNPTNKSGLKPYPEYPIFKSLENSYVYFDKKNIQNGVYDRKNLYFQVYPFTFDSLDNFAKSGMQLKGKFESGGIIPSLEQTLSLREDNSIGFWFQTKGEGVPVYNGAGTFYNRIEMSNKGLRASGQLDYLTSTTISEDFLFHPDSLMCIGRDFTIKKQIAGVQYPEVKSNNDRIRWLPKQDKLNAYMIDKPFNMFNDTVFLNGNLLLQPSGLSGEGKMDLKIASLKSDEFKYKSEQILSDTTDFTLKASQSENFAFNTENVKLNLDFETRKAQFQSNENFALAEFPDNRYISKIDFFTWNMAKELVELGSNKKIEKGDSEDGLIGPRFISVVPAQDSLSFVSGTTLFDYKHSIIHAMDVPYIQVADARIFPKDGNIIVEKNAIIHRLTDAQILADYTTQYYKLYKGSLDITGKYSYIGSADYDYKDETGKIYVIHFATLKADTSAHTVGNAQVSLQDSFRLSPFFEFQGQVRLTAFRPNLTFDGATRIIHDCKIGKSWLKFEAEIDPDSILIPVSNNPIDINLNKIFAGTMITRDSTHIYSAFLGNRKDYFDAFITTTDGFLRYDKFRQNYEIGSSAKLMNKQSPGNYLRLNTDSCYVYSEGDLNFQVEFGQLKMKTVGRTVNNLSTGTFKSDVMMSLDFFFSPVALEIFAKELDSLPDLKAFDLKDSFYHLALRNFIGQKNAEAMESELGLLGYYKETPPEFNKSLILSNVHLTWEQNSRSYIYHGPIGIIKAGDIQINKNVETYIQLSKRSSGDLLDIYFKVNNTLWYYFGYNPGSFQVISTNRTFNKVVLDLKATARKLKVRPGQTGFIYALAPERRAELFLRRFMDIEDASNQNK